MIMGLDLAAANSGICIIKAHYPSYSFSILHQEALHHSMDDARNRIDASNYIGFLCGEHGVDVVSMEDYARRFGRTNTSGYEHAELGGMVKKTLFELGVPFYVVPPTSMRSFMDVPTKSDKEYLQFVAEARLGFKSTASTKKKRSDITDAFIHAHIGSLIHISRNNELDYDMLDSEKRILLGDNKIVGLKDREGIYYDKER